MSANFWIPVESRPGIDTFKKLVDNGILILIRACSVTIAGEAQAGPVSVAMVFVPYSTKDKYWLDIIAPT